MSKQKKINVYNIFFIIFWPFLCACSFTFVAEKGREVCEPLSNLKCDQVYGVLVKLSKQII